MNNFKSNPIAVKSNGITIDILELSLDIQERDFYLEILKVGTKELIARYEMLENTVIELDKSLGEIELSYKDFTGNEILLEAVNLKDSTKEIKVDTELQGKEEILKVLYRLVKEDMDFPRGTELEVSKHTEMLKKSTMDRNARNYVMAKIRKVIVSSDLIVGTEVEKYVYEIYSNLYGMGVLQELDDDIEVGEIMVNASVFPKFKSDIYYIKNGRKLVYDKAFKNLDELQNVFSRAVEFNKKELNSVENAMIEATRANKDRVNIIIPGASENYILNIRKFSNFVPNLQMMKKSGTVDDYLDRLMDIIVRGKANIGIGGEMGTGKTTFINYLLTYTKPIDRKVVIASVSETDVDRVLKGHDVVILNVDDEKGFTFEKLMKASLRTTASRVIVPESRSGEFRQVYEANLKTRGNMFTAHALDANGFMDMCTDMYLSAGASSNENSETVKNKLAKSINIVIIMRTVGDSIRVKSVSEAIIDENKKFKEMKDLYVWEHDEENPLVGRYVRTENRLSDNLKKVLNEAGVKMSELADL